MFKGHHLASIYDFSLVPRPAGGAGNKANMTCEFLQQVERTVVALVLECNCTCTRQQKRKLA